MLTEITREEIRQQKLEEKKKYLKEMIDASARYERLLSNKDFQDVLLDLKNLIKLHQDEILIFLRSYSLTTSFFKKMRLAEVMSQHQLRKEQLEEAVNYPNSIVQNAVNAREELAKLNTSSEEN